MLRKIDSWITLQINSNPAFLTMWSGAATFMTYFCMYMFRKPFTAATFDDITFGTIDFKIALVIAQVAGYAISKFAGIKVISELKSENRHLKILLLIFFSWLGLLGFALSPSSWGIFWLFFNGLPLGLIWGMVFSYCEGRKITEILTVVLSINFILSSGFAKTLGSSIILMGYSDKAMPMIAGLITFPLLTLSIWMLNKIPPPSSQEIVWKSERKPMNKKAKSYFLQKYWLPLILFVALYLILTIVRDIRDNFAPEIWSALGYAKTPAIFAATELPVAMILLIGIGMLYTIKNNHQALLVNLGATCLGVIILITATLLFRWSMISGALWMILSGMGLFLPYILLNGIIFDRFLAAFAISANVGFVMYMADATGYLGSVAILLFRNFVSTDLPWLDFYMYTALILSVPALILSIILLITFQNRISLVQNQNPLQL